MNLIELIDLLKYADNVEVINSRREEIAELFPEIRIMFDFNQENDAHQYDLWYHSLHTVLGIPRGMDDDMLYLAALLHDIGKPSVKITGSDGDSHYKGPQKVSRDIVLKMDLDIALAERYRLLYYVRHFIASILDEISVTEFKHLLLLEISDAKAHILTPLVEERIKICSKLYEKLENNELYRGRKAV